MKTGEPSDIVEAGRYPDFAAAADRALVVLAFDGAYWLFEDDGEFVLYVDARDWERLRGELAAFEAEELSRRKDVPEAPPGSTWSLFVFAWFLAGCFLVETTDPDAWIDLGAASHDAIHEVGEPWRAITALTLHGDGFHLLTNIVFGILFAFGLLPLLGTGLTWAGFLVTGAAGNWINSLLQPSGVRSIGASTAVFGAIGLSVACRITAWVAKRRPRVLREVLLSLGAGVALLALLGTGSSLTARDTDYMAHLWGLVAGLALGPVFYVAGKRWAADRRTQTVLGVLTLAAVAGAWWMALR